MYEIDENSVNQKPFGQSFRSSFYKLFYLLLRDYKPPLLFFLILNLIQTLQLLYFRFNDLVIQEWGNTQAYSIQSFLGYFNYAHYFSQLSYSNFQTLFFITFCVVLLWLSMFWIVFALIHNQKEKYINPLLVVMMQQIMILMSTILQVPFLNTFTVLISCQNGTVSLFPQEYCWQGIIVIYQILSLIFIVLMVFFNTLFGYFLFQPLNEQLNPLSKRNGKCSVINTLALNIVTLTCTLTPNQSNQNQTIQIALIIVLIIVSIVNYIICIENDCYNYRLVQKFIQGFLTIQVYTSLMLGLSAFFKENFTYDYGCLFIWLISQPFVLCSIFLSKNKRENSLILTLTNTLSSQQIIDHSEQVLKLLENDKQKFGDGQLNGYIEFHNQSCNNPSCPLQKVKFPLNLYKKQINVIKLDKRYQMIYEMIQKHYSLAMQRFQDDYYLRIAYALFLLQTLNSKQLALEELLMIEKQQVTTDVSYIVYFLKKIIESEVEMLSYSDEFTEQRDFKDQFTNFKIAIDRCVILIMEFWSQFCEDKPDLLELEKIASLLFSRRLYVDTLWNNLQRQRNISYPKVLILYSKYLMKVFDDRAKGQELMELARKYEKQIQEQKSFSVVDYFSQQYIKGTNSNLNIDGQERGLIFISLEEEKLGSIYAINTIGAQFFGYSKNEILNKNVNKIMPELFARHHDNFLKRFLDTNETRVLGKERAIIGKHKNGYIFPFYILLRPVYHVLKEGFEFYANVRVDKNIKHLAQIIVNQNLCVEDISASCIQILGINLKSLFFKDLTLFQLFPDLETRFEELLSKDQKIIIDYQVDRKMEESTIMKTMLGQQIKLSIQVVPICFLVMKKDENDKGLAGYLIKLEKFQELNITNNSSQLKIQKVDSSYQFKKQHRFQFRLHFDMFQKLVFMGEVSDNGLNASLSASGVNYESFNEMLISDIKEETANLSRRTKLHQLRQLQDYSEGIKIMRLFEGQIHEIEKFIDMDDEDESIQMNRDNKQQEQQELQDEIQSQIDPLKSSQELFQTLIKQKNTKNIKVLWRGSWFLLTILIILSVLANVFEREEIDGSMKDWNLMLKSVELISSLNRIICFSQSLLFLKLGINNLTFKDYFSPITSQEEELKIISENLKQVISQFQLLSMDIFHEFSSQQVVKIEYLNMSSSENDLEYATQQILSTALSNSQISLDDIKEENRNLYFIRQNGLNNYALSLIDLYQNIYQSFNNGVIKFSYQMIIIVIISSLLILLCLFIVSFIINLTIHQRQEILKLFLEIPMKTAKSYQLRCELFISSQGTNQDEGESEVDLSREEDMVFEESLSLLGTKKKKFKHHERNNMTYFIRMIIVVLVIESYFVIIYFIDQYNISQKNQILNEFNQTALIDSYGSLLVNVMKETIFNGIEKVLNNTNKGDQLKFMIYEFQNMLIRYQQIRVKNLQNNPTSYNDYFLKIMYENICSEINASVSCEQFQGGILIHGLNQAIVHHLNQVKEAYFYYLNVQGNQTDLSPLNFTVIDFNKSNQTNALYTILNMPQQMEISNSQNYQQKAEMDQQFLSKGFTLLKSQYLEIMKLNQENFIVQQIVLLIIYILILLFGMLIFWIPFLRKIDYQIWSTKCLFTFIPINEIARNRTISSYIRKLIISSSV